MFSAVSGFILILRFSYRFMDIDSSVILCKSLVRNILEYASVVWPPYHNCNCDTVKSILRRFTRFLTFKKNVAYSKYPERLAFINLLSLQSRVHVFFSNLVMA